MAFICPSWCGCRRHTPPNNIQTLGQFNSGSPVGFTDSYIRQFDDQRCNFSDWVVCSKDAAKGLVEIQRCGLPHTKFNIGWQWIYLK